MCPPPARWGRNARQPWTTPQKFTPITHSHDDSGPNHGSDRGATPALLHTTWTAPKRSSVWAANASTSATLLTSVRTVSTSTPRPPTWAAADSRASTCTSASTRCRPAAAKRSASESPIPLPAPVTTAT